MMTAATIVFAASLEAVASFGSNPGNLAMYRYVPPAAPPGAPLVVVLHGCNQTAADIAQLGWNELADRWRFTVAYPEQKTANNSLRCFNWAGEYGDTSNLVRGQGENESIKQMVDRMKADYAIDTNRVYITGLSGGGAQTTLMLALWPDVFAAGAPIAGIPYDCTTALGEVASCLSPGRDRTPAEWGDLVRAAHVPPYGGRWPRLQIWQGAGDTVVKPMNQTEILEQFANVVGIDTTADASSTVGTLTRAEYRDAAGATLIETMTVAGMDHGAALDPMNGCGTAGPYRLAVGVCSTELIARFFGLAPAGAPDPVDGGSPPPPDRTDGGGAPDDGGAVDGGAPDDGGAAPAPSGCSTGGHPAAEALALVVVAALALLVRARRARDVGHAR